MYVRVPECVYACVCVRMCMRVCVCQADQMLRSSLQGALISRVFTVTDGQQSEAGPAAGRAGMNGRSLQKDNTPKAAS